MCTKGRTEGRGRNMQTSLNMGDVRVVVGLVSCAVIASSVLLVARIPVWIRASSADNIDTDGLNPEMIAYLYGGTKRAILASLGSLRSQSLVTGKSEKIRLDSDARPDDGSTPLGRAILSEAFLPTRYSQLLYAGPIRSAMIQMDKELVDRGLLLTRRQRTIMRRRPKPATLNCGANATYTSTSGRGIGRSGTH